MSILQFPVRGNSFDNGQEPPDNGDMETRIAKLEELATKANDRMYAIERELVRLEGAIRSDMHKEFTAQTWRIVGAMLTFGTMLAAAVFFIARNVH